MKSVSVAALSLGLASATFAADYDYSGYGQQTERYTSLAGLA